MFVNCTSLIEVPLYDMSSVTRAGGMFESCNLLTEVPLFDTRNVREFYNMFSNCTSLEHVPLLATGSAVDTSSMFSGCSNVKSGALALYQQLSTQANIPRRYTDCFANCGYNTASGRAELAQIPTSWGGTRP
jgi:hypothetical protein